MVQMTPIERSRQPFAMDPKIAALVWYESPFGESDWMERSSAERLLAVERVRYDALADTALSPPCIVDRADRIAFVASKHAKAIKKIKAENKKRQRGTLKRGQPRKERVKLHFPKFYVLDSRTDAIVNVIQHDEDPKAVVALMSDSEHLYLERFPNKEQLDAYQQWTTRRGTNA